MQKYVLLLLIALFIFSACKRKDESIPANVIPKNKLIPLLVDYHLAQGISNSTAFRQRAQRYPVVNLTDSVLAAHGYTKAQFDSTLLYYSQKINEFNEIYETVITELNRMQAKIEEKKSPTSDTTEQHPANKPTIPSARLKQKL